MVMLGGERDKREEVSGDDKDKNLQHNVYTPQYVYIFADVLMHTVYILKNYSSINITFSSGSK